MINDTMVLLFYAIYFMVRFGRARVHGWVYSGFIFGSVVGGIVVSLERK